MKKILVVVLQFLLFVALFAVSPVFAVFDPLRLRWFISHPTVTSTRWFSPEGLLLTFGFYLLILLIAAMRKRFRVSAPLTTLALILALLVGLYFKFGWTTHDLLG
jgi:hypothetical protein